MEIVTYQSSNAKPHERWLALARLPSGKLWLVTFHGHSEEAASTQCREFYVREFERHQPKGAK